MYLMQKKRYNYIKNIYNNNTILQDNISYLAFLKEFAKYNYENIVKLRMFEILDIFNLHDVNLKILMKVKN